IVHRLDKDTSGVLVIARTLSAHNKLVAQIGARTIRRQYQALVIGTPVAGGTIDAPIDRDPRDRLRMAVREDGRPAVTHYRVRERFRAHTLLQANLETGRTHQIRVHLNHRKLPLVGDQLYGPGLRLPKGASAELAEALRAFRRQALHAELIEFEHPAGGAMVRVEAPPPSDMRALLEVLREDQDAARASRD
ncbi:MAG: RluA family pseudouridine synthase, partial [Lysobacterales bacterium]